MVRSSLEPGVVIGGRYRLAEVLGQGSMAVVWRAEHTETGRQVALKVVRGELARSEPIRDLFIREARIGARIGKSEYIVDVLDAGADVDRGTPFLAMELLSGEPLDERIRREGGFAHVQACRLLQQVAEALDQAHAAGVVHRDLKPQNLFLTLDRKGEPSVKVLDFGIAKVAESVQMSATHIGTPAYASPEQLGATWRSIAARSGRTIAAQVSPATDVWAFGLLAYELFTGAASGEFWGAPTPAELPAKIFLEPLPVASVRAGARARLLPPGFDAWLARCLALDARERFQSAGEAVRVLLGAASPYAATADPTGRVYSTANPYTTAGHSYSTGHPGVGRAQPALAQTSWPTADPRGVSLAVWAQQRQIQLRDQGDVRTYQAWMPFHFVPAPAAVGREGQVRVHDADVLVAETTISDELRRAVGEEFQLLALVRCSRLRCRVALRSKRVVGIGDGLSKGLRALDDLFAPKPKVSVLGDPWFETHFEVAAPNADEAHAALPVTARQVLVQCNYVSALEMRPGGMVITRDQVRFVPAYVDSLLDLVARLLVL